ncbi:G1/S-specific cyclin-D3-like [Bolinopsis microptera]|uniref:G1/S-specific cyclin-D3-like n=1 Tax=Bolinopsis microptera TaxID=2820187 RepID=UPI0030795A19
MSQPNYSFPDVLPRRLNTLSYLSMFCYESGFENYVPRRAAPDGCNIDDPKTLNNLIRVSKFYEPNPKYLELIQKNNFTIEMRKQLTEWMFEISDVCEEGVLPHAVNLLDRYLSKATVVSPRDDLQVIGAVCLFLASKLRENQPLPVDRLCESGSFSYTSKQVRSWELRILNMLNWDTSAVLPHDLLDHFLHRLPIPDQVKSRVTYHARTLINMCCTEYMFLPHSSTMMATGCLYDAIFALGSKYMELRRTLPELMSHFVDINKDELAVIHSKVRTLIAANRTDLPHVDVEPLQSREKSPGPMHTPKDLLEMEGC